MSTFVIILPMLLTVPFYAVLVKLASRIYHNSRLAWGHAIAFAALGMALGLAGTLLNLSTGNALPSLLVDTV